MNPTLLIVDDEKPTRDGLRAALEDRFDVYIAEDARAIEEAGAFALVLELIPTALSHRVSQSLTIPTIGIGAGVACDGQVLVLHDMLGLNERFRPRFLKLYAQLAEDVRRAAREFAADVRAGRYPADEHGFE